MYNLTYRREIDGLRAVAVLVVIFYHAGFPLFKGGFVGVDIFFVISGFLITQIIRKQLEQGNFSFSEFYERRARRILPALYFTLAISIIPAWFLLLPEELKKFSNSIAATVLFLSNHLFSNEGGYFDTAAELKPLLHTWSLSVEEQFYIFYPFLLLSIWKLGKKWLMIVLAMLALASFSVDEVYTSLNRNQLFFLLPTRAWP